MQDARSARFRDRLQLLRRQFLQNRDLPHLNVLAPQLLTQTAQAAGVSWLERIYVPLVTRWGILGQVLSANHSCRAAVARLFARRTAKGELPCSAATGGYCQARERLPEPLFSQADLQTGRALGRQVSPELLWMGRRLYADDGSSVAVADTSAREDVNSLCCG